MTKITRIKLSFSNAYLVQDAQAILVDTGCLALGLRGLLGQIPHFLRRQP